MAAELQIYADNVLSQEEKKQLNIEFDKYINANKSNRQAINKLVFKCVAAMTTASDTEKELADKKGIKRFIGAITGSNKELQDKINSNRSAAQFAMQACLQKLAAQNLMTFDLITAVNNKLNASLTKIDAEFNNVYEIMDKFIKQTRGDLVRLENVVARHDRNINLLNWQNSIEYQVFNGVEYEYLDPITKIVCLTRDFYDITQGNWTTSDLLLLKAAMDAIDIAPKAKVNYYDALKEIAGDDILKARLLGDIELYPPQDPDCLISFSGLQKISALNNEESYIVDTIAEYVGENKVNIDRNSIEDTLANKYLSNLAQVNINTEIECYNLLLDLLYNLKNYEPQHIEKSDEVENAYDESKVILGKTPNSFNSNVRLASDIEYVNGFAKKGNARAMYLMGIYNLECVSSPKEAKNWLIKAAEAGDALAKFRCDICKRNTELAEEIRKLAEKGDSYACYEMGRICEKGYNGSVNTEEAMEWYRKAKELGNQQADYLLSTRPKEGQSFVKEVVQKKTRKKVIHDTNSDDYSIDTIDTAKAIKAGISVVGSPAATIISKILTGF